jgi:hypothetical protein
MPVIPATWEVEERGLQVQYQSWQSMKYKQRAEGVAQVVECLPSMCQVLGSITSTGKKKK